MRLCPFVRGMLCLSLFAWPRKDALDNGSWWFVAVSVQRTA